MAIYKSYSVPPRKALRKSVYCMKPKLAIAKFCFEVLHILCRGAKERGLHRIREIGVNTSTTYGVSYLYVLILQN